MFPFKGSETTVNDKLKEAMIKSGKDISFSPGFNRVTAALNGNSNRFNGFVIAALIKDK
jgi:hypothetical protein